MKMLKTRNVITKKTDHNKVMKSNKFLLTKTEERKSCIYGVETTNTGMGLQLCWHHLFVMLFEKTVLFMSKRVCKIHFM